MKKKLIAFIACAIIACGGISAGTGYLCYQKGIESQSAVIASLQKDNASLENELQQVSQAEQSEEMYQPGEYWVDTQSDPLGIRPEARQDSEPIGKVPKGANIVIEKTNGRWGYVDYNGHQGWINMQYCSPGINNDYTETDEVYTDDETDMVYIAKTGTVYHTSPDCYHIAGHEGVRTMTREETENEGFRKCYNCP